MKKLLAVAVPVVIGIVAVPLLVGMYMLMMVTVTAGTFTDPDGNVGVCVDSEDSPVTTTAGTVTVDPDGLEVSSVAGYGREQLLNAANIMNAAAELGLDSRAQVIGVMTAMGESSLRNIDYGDNAINPDGTVADSIGLFQQQHWWGTVEQRMDPFSSATLFFRALDAVTGWETLTPTIAAHRVQRNADPGHYEKWFADATEVVSALSGMPLTTEPGAGRCQVGNTGAYPVAEGTEPGAWGGYGNGQIPLAQLAQIPWAPGMYLRGDAADALVELNDAFRADFGYDLPINDAYRDYQGQVEAKEIYGDNAATPGTSNHGWGMAVDFGTRTHAVIGYGSDIYAWLKEHAPAYGWVHPAWAEPDGPGPHEAWHWEYWGTASA